MDKITDIWFCCGLDLEDLAIELELINVRYDAENDWEWVTGYFDGSQLDITRIHWLEAKDTETRIFLLGEDREFHPPLIERISGRLKGVGIEILHLGQWIYLNKEEFELKLIKTLS
jgi:hypothetical protein